MDKKEIKRDDMSISLGFIINNNFITYCQFCDLWHYYDVENDLVKGFRVFRLSKCSKKSSRFFKKYIMLQKFAKSQMEQIFSYRPFIQLKDDLENEKHL